ncbi:hypothetical protein Golob_024457 [Gossypium lobatum]|uniref:Uncharacterized protein n=1 Tax=Gossypium lobatum TaxID=34289 RepID=A0A7J8NF90_9ROSI|nr:hypothetical protein [Gossypium lobatum]
MRPSKLGQKRHTMRNKGDSKCISWKNLKDINSSTPRYEEEGRCICFEYIRLSCIPQGFGTY